MWGEMVHLEHAADGVGLGAVDEHHIAAAVLHEELALAHVLAWCMDT